MGKSYRKFRNPEYLDLLGRKPGPMKDKREPRGGANTFRSLLADINEDLKAQVFEDNQKILDEDSNKIWREYQENLAQTSFDNYLEDDHFELE